MWNQNFNSVCTWIFNKVRTTYSWGERGVHWPIQACLTSDAWNGDHAAVTARFSSWTELTIGVSRYTWSRYHSYCDTRLAIHSTIRYLRYIFLIFYLYRNYQLIKTYETGREREIKFIGLFENRGHRGPYSPYKPFNHNLYIGIIIFPHIDNSQYTGYDLPKKKPNKIINEKKWGPH